VVYLLPNAVVTTFSVKPHRLKKAMAVLRSSVVAAAKREPAFSFIALMTSRSTSQCTVITLWRTEEDTGNGEVPEGYSAALDELADMIEGGIEGINYNTCALRFLETHLMVFESSQ
jgi:hypothetical protein